MKRLLTNSKILDATYELSQSKSINMKKKIERVHFIENKSWSELEVGDIVFLKKNERAPADLLILNSSD
jgi:magnesium-transporting ATPase (P-type)